MSFLFLFCSCFQKCGKKQSGKCRLTLQEGTMFWGRCCSLWERASACGSCFWPENPCGRSRSSPGNGLFSAKTGLHGITGQSPTIYIKQSVTNLKSQALIMECYAWNFRSWHLCCCCFETYCSEISRGTWQRTHICDLDFKFPRSQLSTRRTHLTV